MKVFRVRNKITNEMEQISDRNPTNLYKTAAHALCAITETFWDDPMTRQWAKDNLEVVEYDLTEVATHPYVGKARYRTRQSKKRRSVNYGRERRKKQNQELSKPTEQGEGCVLQSSEALHD